MNLLSAKLLGETTLYEVELPVGKQTLRLVNVDKRIDEKRVVRITADRVTKLKVNFDP